MKDEARGTGGVGRPSPKRAMRGAATTRLVLVTSADPGRLDLVLSAVKRRLALVPGIAFAEPLTTRALPAGSGHVVSRNAFAAVARAGEIRLGWRDASRSIGYTHELVELLAHGVNVIAGAGIEAEAAVHRLWRDVQIVRLEAGTETLRAGLSPHHCAARIAGTGKVNGRFPEGPNTTRVRDIGDLAVAVRDLGAAIERHLPPAACAEVLPNGRREGFPRPADRLEPARAHASVPRQREPQPRPAADRAVKPQPRPLTPT